MQAARKKADVKADRLKAAISYARMGWSVIPLAPRDKVPMADLLPIDRRTGKRTWAPFRDRPATEAEIIAWFEQVPDLNVGVLTGMASGGLVVVDVDKPAKAPTHIPPTVSSATGRPGHCHYYFRSDAEVASQVFPWGELQAEGKYIVAPPSIHPNGELYTWSDFCSPDVHVLAELPPSLMEPESGEGTKKEYILTGYPPDDSGGLSTTQGHDLDHWSKSEEAASAIMRVCGVPTVRLGKSFRCPLPGHEEHKASAALFKQRDGTIRYHDFHRKSGDEWYTLPEVYVSVRAGKMVKLNPGQRAVWMIRALSEAGIVTLPSGVIAPRLPPDAPAIVKDVYAGFKLLLRVRAVYNAAQAATPYTREFAAMWCQRGERSCGEAITWLLKNGYLTRVAKKGDKLEGGRVLSAALFALGNGRGA